MVHGAIPDGGRKVEVAELQYLFPSIDLGVICGVRDHFDGCEARCLHYCCEMTETPIIEAIQSLQAKRRVELTEGLGRLQLEDPISGDPKPRPRRVSSSPNLRRSQSRDGGGAAGRGGSPPPPPPPPYRATSSPRAPTPPPAEGWRGGDPVWGGRADQSEQVVKYFYDVRTDTWTQATAAVIIDPTPFQEGTMRAAFHLLDLSKPAGEQSYVCKMSKDPKEDTATYFVDVEMQALAKLFADEFNKLNPPKKVDFVEASLIKCLERRGQPILAVEPFLQGKYVKHSNNYGFVSEEDRNTPQAFSHFSYCKSKGDLLICDIQGVQDKYTDPQIHSKDGKGFGKGNMGVEGMLKFFQTHRCNSICFALSLPPHQPKMVDHGTVGVDLQKRYAPAQPVQLHPYERSGRPSGDIAYRPRGHPGGGAEQEARLRRAFLECDVDRTGLLDGAAFHGLCLRLGYRLSHQQAREKLVQISSRGPDTLDYRDFVQWWGSGRY